MSCVLHQDLLPYEQFWDDTGRLRIKPDKHLPSDPLLYYSDYLQRQCDVAIWKTLDVQSTLQMYHSEVKLGDWTEIIRDSLDNFMQSINKDRLAPFSMLVNGDGPGPKDRTWKIDEVAQARKMVSEMCQVNLLILNIIVQCV